MFIFDMVKLINYQFWRTGSSELDCYASPGQKPCFSISFASLRLTSRPSHPVTECFKKCLPMCYLNWTWYPLFPALGSASCPPQARPPEASIRAGLGLSLLWQSLLNTAPSYSSSQRALLYKDLQGNVYLKRKTALNYHLGMVRILLKSHGSFKKS